MKIITEAQARELIEDGGAPYRALTDAGRLAVSDWIWSVAASEQDHDAWFAHAEQAANDTPPEEAAIIEMRGPHTHSGQPETLRLESAHVCWAVDADALQ